MEAGVVGNYMVAWPLVTVQLCAHSTDHSRRTHRFFSDDSNNYTENEQVGRTRDADDTFVPHVNAQSSQLFSSDTSPETSFKSKSCSNRVLDGWWRYRREYTFLKRDCKQWTLQMSWSNNHGQRISQVVLYNSIENICTFRGFFSIKRSKIEREREFPFHLIKILPPGIKTYIGRPQVVAQ